MVPLDSITLEPVAIWGGIWLVVAVGWALAAIWIDDDSRQTFGRSVWPLAITLAGAALFLGTWRFGRPILPLVLGLPPAVALVYLGVREVTAPSRSDSPIGKAIDNVVRGVLRPLGLEPWWNRFRGAVGSKTGGESTEAIVLLKKDGSAYGGQGGRGLDKEASLAIKSLQGILGRAIDLGATDVHFEPKAGDALQLRYRIDGMMQNVAALPASQGRALVSTLKVLGDMDIAERRRPQDGSFAILSKGNKYDVRSASGPTNFGEKIALRLLDSEGSRTKTGLDGVGLRPAMVQALRSIIHRSQGMLIVCGPTGSGKTTTVYSALREIDAVSRNILTIEDPIEYRLDGVSQTAVNNAAELTFAKILRSVLRQDPDVILVGEIRDRETAEIAMQAAMTGHFVFTTVHANDCATTVTRLQDIGIEASLLQSAVTAVLAQRLLRVLCPKCKEAYKPDDELLKRLGIPRDKVNTFYKEVGCSECGGSGYRGRTGVHELMVVDEAIRNLLVEKPSVEAIRDAARKNGMRTLWQSALYKVVAGQTSLAEAERVTK